MENSQEKHHSFLGHDTFPNLYDALVYERKFKSEYLERKMYERLLKSEPSIVKLIEKKSDLSKLSTLSEPSIVKFIENQSEHLSKLTLYIKNVLQGDLDMLVNRAEFHYYSKRSQEQTRSQDFSWVGRAGTLEGWVISESEHQKEKVDVIPP